MHNLVHQNLALTYVCLSNNQYFLLYLQGCFCLQDTLGVQLIGEHNSMGICNLNKLAFVVSKKLNFGRILVYLRLPLILFLLQLPLCSLRSKQLPLNSIPDIISHFFVSHVAEGIEILVLGGDPETSWHSLPPDFVL